MPFILSTVRPSVLFTPERPLPVSYSHQSQTYFGCPTCVKPHETRYCNGTNKLTQHLCTYHEVALEKSPRTKADHLDSLSWFSGIVHSGNYPKPQVHLPPSPPTTPPSTSPGNRPISQTVSYPPPTTKVTYAHHNCIHSATPSILILSASDLVRQDHEARVILNAVKLTAAKTQLPSESMKSEILRMEEELLGSRLAKALFFKRCNGEYFNALGGVWEGASDGGKTGKMSGQVLARREELARLGKVDEGDLVVTCWLMNK